MARPQNSPKGLYRKRQIDVVDASGNITALTGNSTGLVLDKGVRLSSQANASLTGNSTGLVVSGGLSLNSSAVVITVNSTGYKLGARYISTNTTGNSAT